MFLLACNLAQIHQWIRYTCPSMAAFIWFSWKIQ